MIKAVTPWEGTVVSSGSASDVAARLRESVVAAVLAPRSRTGRLAAPVLERYASAVSAEVEGVCVWAHTGRGLHLSPAERALVLRTFRQAGPGILIAGVGPPLDAESPTFGTQVDATVQVAEDAAELGADAVMVFPCPALADPTRRHARTIALHQTVGDRTGLPVIAFLLYPDEGGCEYDVPLLEELASLPSVVGVKIATLDRAVQCQDAITAIHAGGGLAITGEDRMLGPSLMWGADAAILGIAAAVPRLTTDVVRSWFAHDEAAFVEASSKLDRFAATTFRDPMEGYVQRMLWAAVWEGTVPAEAALDPWGPRLADGEHDELRECLVDTVGLPTDDRVTRRRPAGR